jgi:hypothetical protein
VRWHQRPSTSRFSHIDSRQSYSEQVLLNCHLNFVTFMLSVAWHIPGKLMHMFLMYPLTVYRYRGRQHYD